jgi:stage II sporulation protein D
VAKYKFIILFVSVFIINSIFIFSKENSFTIRVLLEDKLGKLNLFLNKGQVVMNEEEVLLEVDDDNRQIEFVCENSYLILKNSGKKFTATCFRILSKGGGNLNFKSKKYHGALIILIHKGLISVVNQISIEEYLMGVLPLEIGIKNYNNEYNEAFKAFAITARTFAINRLNSKNYYDVSAGISDQLYGGADVERDIYSNAVEETADIVLYFNNKPAEVFYHSTCGGIIEDAKNVFIKLDVPYLKMKADGDEPFCKNSTMFSWIENYTVEKLRNLLLQSNMINHQSSTITDVYISKKFESGRVEELTIIFENDLSVKLSFRDIRNVLRRNDTGGMLKSQFFEIEKNEKEGKLNEIRLKGKGFGHGVGMCQWGALFQSKIGKNFTDILEFYFPGTELEEIND